MTVKRAATAAGKIALWPVAAATCLLIAVVLAAFLRVRAGLDPLVASVLSGLVVAATIGGLLALAPRPPRSDAAADAKRAVPPPGRGRLRAFVERAVRWPAYALVGAVALAAVAVTWPLSGFACLGLGLLWIVGTLDRTGR